MDKTQGQIILDKLTQDVGIDIVAYAQTDFTNVKLLEKIKQNNQNKKEKNSMLDENQKTVELDKLDKIFEKQNNLDNYIYSKRSMFTEKNKDMSYWIQKKALALFSELNEVINEVNFKWWKNEKTIDTFKLKEELVDVLHFFISMCITAGFSAQELYDYYIAKNKKNIERQNKNDDYNIKKV